MNNKLFPVTPEQRKELEEARIEWRKKTAKLRESIRRSERITAKDLAIVINARADDSFWSPTQRPKRKSQKKRK
ncbi:MAG: hypothetical protein A2431_00965 [Candidatus Zambryskibacteria bacterium RIFOXYC1_FULL_39_10]|uniref:Uncharacterized protein n=1 Tax=Candidatus Zambryskibacteria bacterium RIFOXYC1_FULL_39_10 TaxID=1802779 RepID=A0A1G2V2F9_9BACT|nr:MAG: hypothetical protein A2431_00965 [Candidatus Zambryskibacteria bacterium RIFOXYC1_FULL_39_10]OHB16870.1 MAG: hypothetical protein A2605_00175 [Candidatus Zambryskibacteria bacterium RIFOXYD1_FULL_39_35]